MRFVTSLISPNKEKAELQKNILLLDWWNDTYSCVVYTNDFESSIKHTVAYLEIKFNTENDK